MSTTETAEQALARIQAGFSKNDAAVIYAFAECGVDPADIDPRRNVLTFKAWKAAGRSVAKGATSQRVTIWIPASGKKGADAIDPETGKKRSGRMMPKTARLFHVSQTVPKDAVKGARPAAWNNPHLVKVGTYEPIAEPCEPAPVLSPESVDMINAEAGREAAADLAEVQPAPTTDRAAVRSLFDRADELSAAMDSEQPPECNCPAVGLITNVYCPIHAPALSSC